MNPDQLFNHLLRNDRVGEPDKAIDDRLRHYDNWLAARNLANEASDESVQALLSAVRNRYEIARRWYRLKAQLLGIDLVWFGVMIGMNLQTSFLTPPFGFALFYLRGITDSLFKNGSLPRKVLSSDIYLGAIPWVMLQLLLVVIVIFVPQTVTFLLDEEVKVDLDKVQIEAPVEEMAPVPSTEDMNDLFNETPAEPAAAPASAPQRLPTTIELLLSPSPARGRGPG